MTATLRSLTPLIVTLALAATTQAGEKSSRQGIALLTSQDKTTGELALWRAFSADPSVKASDVWTLDSEGVLSCRGTPKGYIATSKDYTNFTLRLQWRWPAGKPGNGGVLIRMTGPDKIWPQSLEAQINAGQAGDFWGLAGYRLSGPNERMKKVSHPQFGQLINLKKTAMVERTAGEWNQYEIVAQGSTVTLTINGKMVNRTTDCAVVPGKICLTAEGDSYQFRQIELVPNEP